MIIKIGNKKYLLKNNIWIQNQAQVKHLPKLKLKHPTKYSHASKKKWRNSEKSEKIIYKSVRKYNRIRTARPI